MDGQVYQEFFLQPTEATHRRYEAVRAVFIDGDSTVDVAERLNIPHGTLRNWICDFRKQFEAGCIPPFFCPPRAADRRARDR